MIFKLQQARAKWGCFAGFLVCFILVNWSMTESVHANGPMVYSDDFDTVALLVEKWKTMPAKDWEMRDGQFFTKGQGQHLATAKFDYQGSAVYRVEVQASALTSNKWGGVMVGGIRFLIRPDGFWYVYRLEGAKHAKGGIDRTQAIQANRWYQFEIINRGDNWQWRIDGRLVADFNEPNPIVESKMAFSLTSSGMPMRFDNLMINELGEKSDVSPNLILNSSFEMPVDDLIPLGWAPQGIESIPPQNFWENWKVVKTDAMDGDCAIRLNPPHRRNNRALTNSIGVAVGKPVLFSIYLKAQEPDTNVRLVIWEWGAKLHRQEISVGTTWQRYNFQLDKPVKNMVRCGIENIDKDAWVMADAAQLELLQDAAAGNTTEPSPWQKSDADLRQGKNTQELAYQNPCHIKQATVAPVLDGKLDDAVWSDDAKLWDMYLVNQQTPRVTTDTYALMHDDTLYFGVRCHEPQMDQVKTEVFQRDQAKVFSSDVVEICIDPEGDRTDYYHFAVGASGSIFDSGPGQNWSWNGNWQARVYRDETSWNVEIAIPLSMFNLSALTSKRWCVNVGRSQPRLREVSSVMLTPTPNFHQPQRYPVLVMPEKVDFSRCFVMPSDWAIIKNQDGQAQLSGKLINRTGKPQSLLINGELAGGLTWHVNELEIPVNQTRSFSVDLPKLAHSTAGEVKLKASILTAGRSPELLREVQQTVNVHAVLEGVLQRSVYATEKQATYLASLHLPEDQLEGMSLKLEPGQHIVTNLKSQTPITFPIDQLQPGEYRYTVQLQDRAGKVIAANPIVLRKLSADQPAVAIDRVRRCVISDGKPFLVVAPLYQIFDHQPLEDVDRIMEYTGAFGYKSVMFTTRVGSEKYLALWDRIFEKALENKLKVVAWPNGWRRNDITIQMFTQVINRYKNHPALLAWLPVDEPELYTTAEPTIEMISHFSKHDPYHPTYLNNTVAGIPSRFAGLPGDILSIDDYLTNRPNRNVVEIINAAKMVNDVAIPSHRPTWMFIVGNNLHNHTREPTAGEQVAQTYGTVISGVTGIFYFMGDIISPKHWAAVKQTNAELMQLAPVLLSDESAPAAQSSLPGVIVTSRRVGDEIYILAVNLEDKAADVRFELDQPLDFKTCEVLFEDRMLSLQTSVLQDKFEPYQRHVYRLKINR
jgi:hypothetical protein